MRLAVRFTKYNLMMSIGSRTESVVLEFGHPWSRSSNFENATALVVWAARSRIDRHSGK